MREDFYETSVAPEREKAQRTIYTIYTALFAFSIIVFAVTFYFWFLLGDTGFVLLFALSAVFATILYLMRRKLCLYYDYTYISGELRLIKVINGKTRRKHLIIDCKGISTIGKFGSDTYNRLKSSNQYKIKIATPNGLNAERQLYYIACMVDGEQLLVILECEEKLLSYIVGYRGKSIIEKDYA